MKFAFVTPRYGADIPAGAEHACRLLAERVGLRHDVDVLTTCARDLAPGEMSTPKPPIACAESSFDRFAVNQIRDNDAFQRLSSRVLAEPHNRADAEEWVERWGPRHLDLLTSSNATTARTTRSSSSPCTTQRRCRASPQRQNAAWCSRA